MDKVYIAITGRRNTGKSSLINTLLGQEKAVVSDVPGTTTDPVKKSFEIPGMASVVFVDTAGTDDEGPVGRLRVEKTFATLQEADAALLLITNNTFGSPEEELIKHFHALGIPFLIVHNKSDRQPLQDSCRIVLEEKYRCPVLDFSTRRDTPAPLIEALSRLLPPPSPRSLLGSLVKAGQQIVLVTPIDSEAPAGRLILPQVQVIRDALDHHAACLVVQPEELPTLTTDPAFHPDLVITDSQVFARVAACVPEPVPLTSFSILLAHHKGNFNHYLQGTRQIAALSDGDRILMLESCSHHTSCEDIGRVKIPALLRKHTGKQLNFDFIAGLDRIGRPFTDYALIIQCGGCMVTSRQLRNRLQPAISAGVPVSNYGMTIAWIQGIFERATAIFRNAGEG